MEFWSTFIITVLALEIGVISPNVIGPMFLRRYQPDKALPWLKMSRGVSRVLPSWRGFNAVYMAAYHLQKGEYGEALVHAEVGVKETSKSGHRELMRQSAKFYLGIALLRHGEFAQAEAILTELQKTRIFSSPKSQAVLEAQRGVIATNQGRFQEASTIFKKYLAEATPGSVPHVSVLCSLSLCAYYEGDLAQALDLAQQAVKKPSTLLWLDAGGRSCQMVYLVEMGELTQAQEIEAWLLSHLQELPPTTKAGAMRAIAQLALKNGDLDRARNYAEQAYPLDPNPNTHASALLIQAEVFATRKNPRRVQDICGEIQRLNALDFYKTRAQKLLQSLESPSLPSFSHLEEAPEMQSVLLG